MKKETPIKTFLVSGEAIKKIPYFYRHLELYTDDVALDVEDCNIKPSHFHQTSRHTVGYFYKKAAVIQFDTTKILFER